MLDGLRNIADALKDSVFKQRERNIQLDEQYASQLDLENPKDNLFINLGTSVLKFNKDISDASYLHTSTIVGSELNNLLNEVKDPNVALTPEKIKHISETISQIEQDHLSEEGLGFVTPESKAKIQQLFSGKIQEINRNIFNKAQQTNRNSANMFLNADFNTMGLDDFSKSISDKKTSANLKSLIGEQQFQQKVSVAWNKKLDSHLKNPNNSIEDKISYLNLSAEKGYISKDDYQRQYSLIVNSDFNKKVTLSQNDTIREAPQIYSRIKDGYNMPLNNLNAQIEAQRNINNPSKDQIISLKGLEHIRDLRVDAMRKNGLDPLIQSEVVSVSPLPTGNEIAHNILSQVSSNGNNYISPLSTSQEKAYENRIPELVEEIGKAQNILKETDINTYDYLNTQSGGSQKQKALWNVTQDFNKGAFKDLEVSKEDISAYYAIREMPQVKNNINRFIIFHNNENDNQLDINDSKIRDEVGMILFKNNALVTTGMTKDQLEEKFKNTYLWWKDDGIDQIVNKHFASVGGQSILGGDKRTMRKIMDNLNNQAGKLYWLPSGNYEFRSSRGNIFKYDRNGNEKIFS